MPGAEGTGPIFTFPKPIPVLPGTGCAGQLQPVPPGVVPGSHRWLPWHLHHQLHYVLAQRLGFLCHPAPILPRQDVSCQRGVGMTRGASREGSVKPASDQCSLRSDYASLNPLDIKQNNKQVRWGGINAWRKRWPRAKIWHLSVGEESVGCWAPAVAFGSSATFYSFSLLNYFLWFSLVGFFLKAYFQ